MDVKLLIVNEMRQIGESFVIATTLKKSGATRGGPQVAFRGEAGVNRT